MSSHPDPQTTSDLAAVASALRSHERFAITTHENPDGDALIAAATAGTALVDDYCAKKAVAELTRE